MSSFKTGEERRAFVEKLSEVYAKYPNVTEIVLPSTILLKPSTLTYTVLKSRRPRDDAKPIDFSQLTFPQRTPRASESASSPVQGVDEDDD